MLACETVTKLRQCRIAVQYSDSVSVQYTLGMFVLSHSRSPTSLLFESSQDFLINIKSELDTAAYNTMSLVVNIQIYCGKRFEARWQILS